MENRVYLIGRIKEKPVLNCKTNKSGSDYKQATIQIATSEKRRDMKTRELIVSTEWHKVIVYNDLAEYMSNILNKGDLITVCGQLKYYTSVNEEQNIRNKVSYIYVNTSRGGYVRQIINQQKINMLKNGQQGNSEVQDDFDNIDNCYQKDNNYDSNSNYDNDNDYKNDDSDDF